MSNYNSRKSYNRPELPESTMIDLRGRKVGSEDMAQAGLSLKWCENEVTSDGRSAFRGTSLRIAGNVAMGLEATVQLSLLGNHEAAAKKAGTVLWILNKDRTNSKKGNYRAIGSIRINCRDGHVRAIGEIVEWYMSVHFRINEQILKARETEAKELEAAELEALQFAMSIVDGESAQAMKTTKAA
jgi:hypothetical protein